ncbi:exo-beta-N-acetylmuramidase NamZ family protein [Leptobacterium flavescens]|nr:DUF1343 domain-containing protein [Leptobacterium flavescens]
MAFFISLKNTFLLLLFLISSCGNKNAATTAENNDGKEDNKTTEAIVTGANRTEVYLPLLKGKNVGVVANQTSVIYKKDRKEGEKLTAGEHYTHLVDSLLSLGVNLKKVFSPEHGFRGKADAGEKVKDGVDTKTGLPITSLYGKNRKPTAEQLEGLDLVIFDIQDVGVRFYTYISTLHLLMEACAENNIPVMVMDRPNPNGHYIDGPSMEPEHTSFLGMHTIPLVHGMTIGEYAGMINGEKWLENGIQCELEVIPMENYDHSRPYSVPIKPSPNLPTDKAINLYPSLGLFEGTTINAGRGTDYQFQIYGAPFLDKTHNIYTYTPQSNEGAKYPKHKDVQCFGTDLRKEEDLSKLSLKWIISAYANTPEGEKFFNTDSFTKHAGTEKLQKQIEEGLSEEEIRKSWRADLKKFKKVRAKYLIYN